MNKLFKKKVKKCNHKYITFEAHKTSGCIKCGIRPCNALERLLNAN